MSADGKQDDRTVRMENNLYRLDVASGNGAIVRIYDKVGELDLIMEPSLADNKDLNQQLFWSFQTKWGLQGAMTYPELFFKHPEHLGMLWMDIHNLRLGRGIYFGHHARSALPKVLRAELQPGAGSLRAPGTSWPRTVSEVWYPIVGGISGIGDRAETRSTLCKSDNTFEWYLASAIDPCEANTGAVSEIKRAYAFEDWKTPDARGSGNETGTPRMDMYNVKTRRGLYFASHDTCCRAQAFRFEKRPGIADDGGPDYSSPIGFMHWKFADIPRWAKGARDHGVNTVHIAGWMEGGHYADQPSYRRPAPRDLGGPSRGYR